jgi:hypothetical protein
LLSELIDQVDPFISFGSSPDLETYLSPKPQSLCSIRVLARGQHLLSRSLASQGTPRYTLPVIAHGVIIPKAISNHVH